jgi:ATP-dependent DNA ligase
VKGAHSRHEAVIELRSALGVAFQVAAPVQNFAFPPAAASALPTTIRLALASSSEQPREGEDWRHEVRYGGLPIVAVRDGGGGLRLITRNGQDRTPLFPRPVLRSAVLPA